jgi:hypothetical protein
MAWHQLDPHFRFVCFLVVILRDPFTDLGNRHPGNWIVDRIVIRRTIEHTNPQQAFFQKFAAALQRLLYDESKQRGIPPTVLEVGCLQQTLHLASDLILLFLSFRDP